MCWSRWIRRSKFIGATLTGTSLQIDIEDGASTTVDLAGLQDGTGTDDQNLSEVLSEGNTASDGQQINIDRTELVMQMVWLYLMTWQWNFIEDGGFIGIGDNI